MRDPQVFEALISHVVHHITSHTVGLASNKKIDVIVGLDARGFLLGPIVALRLGAAFVPVRKQGKLPGQCIKASYEKEYGTVRTIQAFIISFCAGSDEPTQDIFEMQADAIQAGQNVVIIDDLIATGTVYAYLPGDMSF